MSATLTATPETTAAPAPKPTYKVTFGRVLRSEGSKFLSLRSSWITLAVGLFFLAFVGIMVAYRYNPADLHGPAADSRDAIDISLKGVELSQLALGVLGVLATAGEYTTGLIRSTFAAVPKRLPVLWTKCLVLFGAAIVVATAGAFISFVGGENFLHGKAIALTLSSSGVLRCLFGAGLYLALVTVFGAALGMLVRSVAGGIALLVGIMMLLPVFLDMLPSSWKTDVAPYLPGTAGQSIYSLHTAPGALSSGTGLWVFVAWVAAALIGAAYRVVRSDS
ncbi:ABC transporter permease [Streptacidiphilus pinicola]|uniref:ABC transporter permease n=1 Tax=Streptacidiphilus pinicola TaxID=2219663 RepID=A0A2X0JBK6_9ACTN|nr:ABC transporter permease [Streptacidiphilus pinicola]RAG87686.1 ABC transporter permease [Streptacidiphilus pinicola]